MPVQAGRLVRNQNESSHAETLFEIEFANTETAKLAKLAQPHTGKFPIIHRVA